MKCKLLFLFHSDHQLLSEVLLSRKDLINADFQVVANDFISSETTEQTNCLYLSGTDLSNVDIVDDGFVH